MRNLGLPMVVLLLIGPGIVDSAAAQTTPAHASRQSAKSAPDPNEIVCEKEQELGSRLVHHKVCMTRAQWEDSRRQDRQAIEKAQMQRGLSG